MYYFDPEKSNKRSRKYSIENKDKVNATRRKRKRKYAKYYKKYRQQYDRKNKLRIQELQRKRSLNFAQKESTQLTDNYIISKIKQRTSLSKKDILKYPELIQAWRMNLKLKREI